MTELRQLRVFVAVAELASFSRAAEVLFVSQPAVSVTIRNMEVHYGVALLHRRGKRVEPTEPGRVLMDHARRVLSAAEEAEAAMASIRGLESGRVRIAASTLPGTYVLPVAIGRFAASYPGVAVSLSIRDTRAAVAEVMGNAADFGVIGSTECPPELAVIPVMDDELVLITAAEHRLAGRKRIALGDLEGEAFACREPGSGTREVIERGLQSAGLTRRVVMELGTVDAVKQAVIAGLGVAFVSRRTVGLEVEVGRLCMFRVPRLGLVRKISVVYRRDSSLSPAVAAFVRMLAHGGAERADCAKSGPVVGTTTAPDPPPQGGQGRTSHPDRARSAL